MNKPDGIVRGLGEVSLRVRDLGSMQKFYEDVIGLAVLRRGQDFVFFKIAEGFDGHTQNLALFDAGNRDFLESKSMQLSPEGSTLHHIALNIPLENYDSEQKPAGGTGAERGGGGSRLAARPFAVLPRPGG